jgi:hypothetical protein
MSGEADRFAHENSSPCASVEVAQRSPCSSRFFEKLRRDVSLFFVPTVPKHVFY